jgi:hypothetical protein
MQHMECSYHALVATNGRDKVSCIFESWQSCIRSFDVLQQHASDICFQQSLASLCIGSDETAHFRSRPLHVRWREAAHQLHTAADASCAHRQYEAVRLATACTHGMQLPERRGPLEQPDSGGIQRTSKQYLRHYTKHNVRTNGNELD